MTSQRKCGIYFSTYSETRPVYNLRLFLEKGFALVYCLVLDS